MSGRFEDFWGVAGDGASSYAGTLPATNAGGEPDENRLLMIAWYRERTGRIESDLVLKQALRLIAGLEADGGLTPGHRRKARQVMNAIRRNLKRDDGEGADATD